MQALKVTNPSLWAAMLGLSVMNGAVEARAGQWEIVPLPADTAPNAAAEYTRRYEGTTERIRTEGVMGNPTYTERTMENAGPQPWTRQSNPWPATGSLSTSGGRAMVHHKGRVRTIFRWKRDQLPNSSTLDPTDNPPLKIKLKIESWGYSRARTATGDGRDFSAKIKATATVDNVTGTPMPVTDRDTSGRVYSYSTSCEARGKRVYDHATGGLEEVLGPWINVDVKGEALSNRFYQIISTYDGRTSTYIQLGGGTADASYDAQIVGRYSVAANPGSGTGSYPPVTDWNNAIVSPNAKEFYCVVKATVSFPDSYTPDPTINVIAERIRVANGVITLTGETTTVPPLALITRNPDPEGDQPQSDGNGNKTWTYRTHMRTDQEENRLVGSADWKVSQLSGRWRLRVAPTQGESNRVEFKVDKRGQLVAYAKDWANFYQLQNIDSVEHPYNNFGPNGVFYHCFSFAAHVYGKLGLTIPGNDGTAMFGAATAPDANSGSLRFFWSKGLNPPSGVGDPGHVGVVADTSWTGYPQRVDNNGRPAGAYGFVGPTRRNLDAGVGTTYTEATDPDRAPISRTLPAKRGGLQPNNFPKSLLQELDEE